MPSVGRAHDMNSLNGDKPCRRRVWEHVPIYAGMGFTLLYSYELGWTDENISG